MSTSARPYRVLVTGNEPTFRCSDSAGVNPSWTVSQALDGTYLTSPPALPSPSKTTATSKAQGRPVLISAFNTQIPNIYSKVPPLIKEVHSYSWDLIVHLGVGQHEDSCLWIESQSGFKAMTWPDEGPFAHDDQLHKRLLT